MQYTIKSYKELTDWTSAFAEGSFGLMCVVGNPGCSKSTTVLKAIPADDRVYLKGGALTAFALYKILYLNRDKTIVMDDTDSLYNDRSLIRLLKALCETEKSRVIEWNSANKSLDAEGIPRSFVSKSRVIVIVNKINDEFGRHLESLIDRGILLKFFPSPRTVFEYGKTFFKDKEIVDFIDHNLDFASDFSLRVFENARQAKLAKLNWKESVLETLDIKEVCLVHRLMRNNHYTTDEERIREFMKQTGLSRPMYHKYREQIESRLGKPSRENHRTKRKRELVGV
jgi:hypothetical protein